MPAFCQDVLVHSFVKQRKPHVSCSGKEKNNGGLENRKTKVDEFQSKRMKPNNPEGWQHLDNNHVMLTHVLDTQTSTQISFSGMWKSTVIRPPSLECTIVLQGNFDFRKTNFRKLSFTLLPIFSGFHEFNLSVFLVYSQWLSVCKQNWQNPWHVVTSYWRSSASSGNKNNQSLGNFTIDIIAGANCLRSCCAENTCSLSERSWSNGNP